MLEYLQESYVQGAGLGLLVGSVAALYMYYKEKLPSKTIDESPLEKSVAEAPKEQVKDNTIPQKLLEEMASTNTKDERGKVRQHHLFLAYLWKLSDEADNSTFEEVLSFVDTAVDNYFFRKKLDGWVESERFRQKVNGANHSGYDRALERKIAYRPNVVPCYRKPFIRQKKF